MVNIGDNIKRIRISRNLKQADVYSKAGLSRIAYLNIENGKSIPNSTSLIKLSSALGTSLNDLIAEPQKLTSLRYRFHKVESTKDKNRRIEEEIKLSRWLRNFNFLEKTLKDTVPYKLKDLTANDPIDAARKVRAVLKIDKNEPILDIISLLESTGIKVYLYQSPLKQNFGMSVDERDGGPVVAVNTNNRITIERQIFTAAHELGHLVIHKDSYDESIIDENPEEEHEADTFASHFLMPDELFQKKFNETKGKNWIDAVLHVKRFFKVSYLTVLIRLIDSRKADSRIFREFATEYRQRYQHDLKNHYEPDGMLDEPDSLSKSDIMAERFNRLIYTALAKELITHSKAAEMMDVTLAEMKAIVRSWRFQE